MSDKLESQVQTVWGWAIAVHLFLAGAGAGCYAVGVLASFAGPQWARVALTGIALAFALLALDTALLIRDLGVKSHALRVFAHPATSWIARGSWIIAGVMTLVFVHLVALLQPQLGIGPGVLRAISVAGLAGAIAIMIYTGALLTASRAIAFWNNALLPVLFVLSATASGMMAILLLMPPTPALAEAFLRFARIDVLLILLQLAALALYIQASHRTHEARASAHLLMKGRLAIGFWLGLVGVGLVAPLALEMIATFGGDPGVGTLWMLKAAAVARLSGTVLMPRLILAAGIRTPLRAAGIEFTFPTPALR
jgi:polysulfide reductase chain C